MPMEPRAMGKTEGPLGPSWRRVGGMSCVLIRPAGLVHGFVGVGYARFCVIARAFRTRVETGAGGRLEVVAALQTDGAGGARFDAQEDLLFGEKAVHLAL